MNKVLLSELFQLSPSERLQLAEDLWDSVTANAEDMPPLTDAQRAELDRRVADYRANPESMAPWAEVRKRLWALVFYLEAESEISEASTWYEERGKGLGSEFLRAFEGTLAAIERNPFQYAVVHKDVRRAPLRQFPYTSCIWSLRAKCWSLPAFMQSARPLVGKNE